MCLATVLVLAACPGEKIGPGYFVISERDIFHGDSYLIYLADPEDAAHAREIIRNPETAESQILVANIAPGSGSPPNRAFLNDGLIRSWHVTEFTGFADFTAEILDGWPSFIEEDVAGWIQNTGGAIGFWSYTAVREVSENEALNFE